MRYDTTITKKMQLRNGPTNGRNRESNGRFISSRVREFSHFHHNKVEGELNQKESYNSGSTYGEHQ